MLLEIHIRIAGHALGQHFGLVRNIARHCTDVSDVKSEKGRIYIVVKTLLQPIYPITKYIPLVNLHSWSLILYIDKYI